MLAWLLPKPEASPGAVQAPEVDCSEGLVVPGVESAPEEPAVVVDIS